MGVYGVGRSKAIQWVMQGLRTLQDVLDHGHVTENQRIGIALYDVSLQLNFIGVNCLLIIIGLCAENSEGGS